MASSIGTSSQVEVTDTVASIRATHHVKNISSGETIIYVGGSDLTVDNGYPLAVGDDLVLSTATDLYVVVADGKTGLIAILGV